MLNICIQYILYINMFNQARASGHQTKATENTNKSPQLVPKQNWISPTWYSFPCFFLLRLCHITILRAEKLDCWTPMLPRRTGISIYMGFAVSPTKNFSWALWWVTGYCRQLPLEPPWHSKLKPCWRSFAANSVESKRQTKTKLEISTAARVSR